MPYHNRRNPRDALESLHQNTKRVSDHVDRIKHQTTHTVQVNDIASGEVQDPTEGEIRIDYTDNKLAHYVNGAWRKSGAHQIDLWRGHRITDQLVGAGLESAIVWDEVENTNTSIFSGTAPTSQVTLRAPGTYAISAWYDWDNFPDDPAFCWIAVQDLWDYSDANYRTKSGYPQFGDVLSWSATRTYPPAGETVLTSSSPVAIIQVDAGNGDSSSHNVGAFAARLEIAFLGTLHPSIVWHD